MDWAKERDLLIAQTLAFVQSVSDKMPEVAKLDARLATKPRTEAAPIDAIRSVEPPPATRFDMPPPSFQAPAFQASNIQAPGVPAANIEASIPLPRPRISGDVRAEMQNRIASFRANQQRFHRERQEFYSATLAKVRVATDDSAFPPRRK
jgi:hypothetical protein